MRPDLIHLQDAASELGLEAAYIEKDWYAVRLLNAIYKLQDPEKTLIFTGGTCLSKGYQLINRFSEDLDFCCSHSLTKPNKVKMKKYKNDVISVIDDLENVTIDHHSIIARNQNYYFKIPIKYDSFFRT